LSNGNGMEKNHTGGEKRVIRPAGLKGKRKGSKQRGLLRVLERGR